MQNLPKYKRACRKVNTRPEKNLLFQTCDEADFRV